MSLRPSGLAWGARRTTARRLRPSLFLFLPLIACTLSCDGCDDAPDAPESAADATVDPIDPRLDKDLGLVLSIPLRWHIETRQGEEDKEKRLILSARRKPNSAKPYLVAPRLVVSARPLEDEPDVEDLLSNAIERTKASLPPGQARVRRTTTSRWAVDAVRVASFSLDYVVLDPKGGSERGVKQKSVVAVREDMDQRPHEVHVSVTYMAADDDSLGREVDTMLRSLNFVEPEKPESP